MSLTNPEAIHPRILVFAGPNGSGKSTVTKGIPLCGLYINADEIKRISHCSDLEAAQEAELLRETLLRSGKDFTFETVLSTDRNLELLKRAKEKDYEIYAIFVMTKDSSINVQRVHRRAQAGGHDVPKDKIISRYQKSLKNLSRLVRIADHTRIIDNSGELPVLICEVHGSSVTIYDNPSWSKKEILVMLSQKYKEDII